MLRSEIENAEPREDFFAHESVRNNDKTEDSSSSMKGMVEPTGKSVLYP